MYWVVVACILFNGCFAQAKQDYFDYLNQYSVTLGPLGNSQLGEIEIITDLKKIVEIEISSKRQVGVIAQDNYWIWLNDAVQFPNGKYGVYGRILWRQSLKGVAGVAVLPILPNGKVFLNRNFRHATRSWEYELPRGGLMENETAEDGALREMKEETGLIADVLHFLGEFNPDSGLTNTVVPVYLAQVIEKQAARPEDSEAIAGVEAFSIAELKQGFLDGYLLNEDGTRIHLRDPFLAFASANGSKKS